MLPVDPLRNVLLAALPPEDIAHLNGALEPVAFTQNEPLYQQATGRLRADPAV